MRITASVFRKQNSGLFKTCSLKSLKAAILKVRDLSWSIIIADAEVWPPAKLSARAKQTLTEPGRDIRNNTVDGS